MLKPLLLFATFTGLTLGALFAFADSAFGDEYLRWETEDGVVAFADDPRKVPARYRDAAEVVQAGTEAARITPLDAVAVAAYRTALAERLEHLSAINLPEEFYYEDEPGPGGFNLRSASVEVPFDGAETFETVTFRERDPRTGGATTRMVTETRADGEVIERVLDYRRMSPLP